MHLKTIAIRHYTYRTHWNVSNITNRQYNFAYRSLHSCGETITQATFIYQFRFIVFICQILFYLKWFSVCFRTFFPSFSVRYHGASFQFYSNTYHFGGLKYLHHWIDYWKLFYFFCCTYVSMQFKKCKILFKIFTLFNIALENSWLRLLILVSWLISAQHIVWHLFNCITFVHSMFGLYIH